VSTKVSEEEFAALEKHVTTKQLLSRFYEEEGVLMIPRLWASE